jgi:hypothetical protein
MATATYDFTEGSIVIGGFSITGFADVDDAIAISRRNDMWDLLTGADGDSVFIKKSDKSGVITLKLLPSSASNDTLSVIALGQENNGLGPVPVLHVDNNGNTLAAAEQAVIIKIPDAVRGKNLTSNDWGLLCADMSAFVGGMS